MRVAVLGGMMHAVAGYDGTVKLSSMVCFDPSTGQWSIGKYVPLRSHGGLH